MRKIKYFNDTDKAIRIHPVTWEYCFSDSEEPIQPLEVRTFEYPDVDGYSPVVIKQWSDGCIAIIVERDM